MKIDFYRYAKDRFDRCKALAGVHYQNGEKVATDGALMIVEQCSYDSTLEGLTINKRGEAMEGKYPDYQKVIPAEITGNSVNLDGMLKAAKARHTIAKAHRDMGDQAYFDNVDMKAGDSWFKSELFVKFLEFAKYIGAKEMFTNGTNAAYCKTEKGVALIMPCYHIEKGFVSF